MTDDFFKTPDTRPVSTVDSRLRSLVSQLIKNELDLDSAITLLSGDFEEVFGDWLKHEAEGDKSYLLWSLAKQTYMQLSGVCDLLIGHICTIREEDAPLIKNPYNETMVAGALKSLVIRAYNNQIKIEEAQNEFALRVSQIYEAFSRSATIYGVIENGYNFEVALVAIQDSIYLVLQQLSELSKEDLDVGHKDVQGGIVGQGELGSGDSSEPDSSLPVRDDDHPDQTS